MFDDPKQELKRIEKALLEQMEDKDWLERELADIQHIMKLDHTNGYGVKNTSRKPQPKPAQNAPAAPARPAKNPSVGNTDRVDVDLSSYSDEVMEEPVEKKEKSLLGLVILVLLELVGIGAVGIYWLLMLS